MKKIVILLLNWFTRRILSMYHPHIIGVTGNVGKTSATHALYAVLSSRFSVRKNIKNYNNEFGIPLTIIGKYSGGKSLFRWLSIFWKAIMLLIFRDASYPKILILEMGIDHPGDMDYIMKLITLNTSVVTAIDSRYPVHLEFFKDVHHLAKEKMKIATSLKKDGAAVLNADSPLILSWIKKIRARIFTFGFSESAQIRASDVVVSKKLENLDGQPLSGVSFKLWHKGSVVPVLLPNVLGVHQVNAGLVGASVGILFGMNCVDIAEALRKYQPPAGRMHLLKGIKNTLLIDDSYNASPIAMMAALKTLKTVEVTGRKFACLGDMAELGIKTRSAHEEIGTHVASIVHSLFTVGMSGKIIADAAIRAGMSPDEVFTFSRAEEAGRFIQDRLKQGDILLVKGSQKMRLEKVVKELMADPLRASELLVRQEKEWQS